MHRLLMQHGRIGLQRLRKTSCPAYAMASNVATHPLQGRVIRGIVFGKRLSGSDMQHMQLRFFSSLFHYLTSSICPVTQTWTVRQVCALMSDSTCRCWVLTLSLGGDLWLVMGVYLPCRDTHSACDRLRQYAVGALGINDLPEP
jgi:hypothetical protein